MQNQIENNQVPVYDFDQVAELSKAHIAHIEEIKGQVSEEYDNINSPEPFIVSPV